MVLASAVRKLFHLRKLIPLSVGMCKSVLLLSASWNQARSREQTVSFSKCSTKPQQIKPPESWIFLAASTQHCGFGFKAGPHLSGSKGRLNMHLLQRHTYKNAICEIIAQTCESGFFAGPANGRIFTFYFLLHLQ